MNLLEELYNVSADACYGLLLSDTFVKEGFIYSSYLPEDIDPGVIEQMGSKVKPQTIGRQKFLMLGRLTDDEEVELLPFRVVSIPATINTFYETAKKYPRLSADKHLTDITAVFTLPDNQVDVQAICSLWNAVHTLVMQEAYRPFLAKERGQLRSFIKAYPSICRELVVFYIASGGYEAVNPGFLLYKMDWVKSAYEKTLQKSKPEKQYASDDSY